MSRLFGVNSVDCKPIIKKPFAFASEKHIIYNTKLQSQERLNLRENVPGGERGFDIRLHGSMSKTDSEWGEPQKKIHDNIAHPFHSAL